MKNSSAKLVDLTYLRQRTQSDPELMKEMINIYLEQTPVLVTAMREGFQKQNWDLLQAAAHKISPSFRIMGIAGDNESVTRKIQELATLQLNSELLPHMISSIEEICSKVYDELRDELKVLKK